MIELRWFHDPSGQEVTRLQWRESGHTHVLDKHEYYYTTWTDVPHVWPSEHYVKGDTSSSPTPSIKE